MPTETMLARGMDGDTPLYRLVSELSGSPSLAVLLGTNAESLALRAVRVDTSGRLLVNGSSQRFDIINVVLLDAVSQVFSGAGVFRKIVFYVQNANALLSFRRADNSLTAEITAVPNVPLTIEGVFLAVLGRNSVAGVPSTLQAVVNSDLLAGQ